MALVPFNIHEWWFIFLAFLCHLTIKRAVTESDVGVNVLADTTKYGCVTGVVYLIVCLALAGGYVVFSPVVSH